MGDWATLDEWIKARETAKVDFGKHRDKQWKNMPEDYLQWLSAQNKTYKPEGGIIRYQNAMCARLELQFRKENPQHLN